MMTNGTLTELNSHDQHQEHQQQRDDERLRQEGGGLRLFLILSRVANGIPGRERHGRQATARTSCRTSEASLPCTSPVTVMTRFWSFRWISARRRGAPDGSRPRRAGTESRLPLPVHEGDMEVLQRFLRRGAGLLRSRTRILYSSSPTRYFRGFGAVDGRADGHRRSVPCSSRAARPSPDRPSTTISGFARVVVVLQINESGDRPDQLLWARAVESGELRHSRRRRSRR